MAQSQARLSPPPAIEPKVATPKAHHKRRHSTLDKGEVRNDDFKHRSTPAHAHGREGKNGGTKGNVVGMGGREHVNGAGAKQPRLEIEKTNGTNGSGGLKHDEANGRPQSSGSGTSDWSGAGQLRRLSSSNGSNVSDDSFLEDMADTVELEPYKAVNEDDDGYPDETIKMLLSRLRRLGPDGFLTELFETTEASPRMLGTAFGIHPDIYDVYGEQFHMALLVRVVDRAHKKREKLKQYNTIDDAAALLREKKQIMVITGAGISTSLGIPDFRSRHGGFYEKLREMGIKEPEEVFDIYEFDESPARFFNLVGDLLPDVNRYSPTHKFLSMLQDMGKLQTNYTQNIDNLEQLAGIRPAQLIQCHGSFATASCRKCGHKVTGTDIFPEMRAQQIPYCKVCTDRIAAEAAAPKRKKQKSSTYRNRYACDDDDSMDDDIPTPGVMKPDIIFFGEQLPETFFNRFTYRDCKTIDLVIVIGTSMKVSPVSEMPNHLPKQVPHIYINKEPVEHVNFDIQLLGKCDDVVFELARRAGWRLEHERIPEGLEFCIDPVEGKEHHWKIMKLMK